jgi:putative oxidoreductase
LHFVL